MSISNHPIVLILEEHCPNIIASSIEAQQELISEANSLTEEIE